MPPAKHDAYLHSRLATAVWVLIFFCCSGFYVIVHFALQTVAFFKVFTRSAGKWTITLRSANPASGREHPLAEPLLEAEGSA